MNRHFWRKTATLIALCTLLAPAAASAQFGRRDRDDRLGGGNERWENAQQILTDAELSDGLPLVPPTHHRLEAMVAGVAGRGESHGLMPPMFGDLTAEAVAYQCVIAGCVPAELPVVLMAAAATLEPDFNLLGVATTTGTAGVALCVHGPIARRLNFNSREGVFGNGYRSNAAVGRAVRLAMWNLGGAIPGSTNMSTLSNPADYAFCIAEEAEDNPWEPMHVERGCPPGSDAVTVFDTAEVLPAASTARTW